MNPMRSVILALTVSGIVFAAANGLEYVNDQNGKRIANPLPKLGGWEMVVAWSVVILTLSVMAEIPATGELAVSFAWLVMLAMILSYGLEAAQNLMLMMGGESSGADSPNSESERARTTRPVVE